MNQGFIDKIRKDLHDIKAYRYPHIKLVMLWTILEAWIIEHSRKTRQVDAMNWFRLNNNPLKDCADGFWAVNRAPRALVGIATHIGLEIPQTQLQMKKLNKHQPGSMYLPDANNKGDVTALMCEVRHKIVHGQ